MRKGIHPQTKPVVFVDSATKTEFTSVSTITSESTKSIDGVEHNVVNVQISSASHPHYTGKADQLVDTFDTLKRFTDRVSAANKDLVIKKRKKAEARKTSSVSQITSAKAPTLKDMMKQLQQK
ncbi:MAG: 50S ribosomal protein L31 [Candidatus Doudnabacteria bacterium]|nr:50S ribosomal protein L31 [Candidatus Doudnabacteria bacterium]